MEWNYDMEAAPRDGTEFIATLSNDWVVLMSEIPGRERYAWYRVSAAVSVPVTRTHNEISPDTLTARAWKPKPAPAPPKEER